MRQTDYEHAIYKKVKCNHKKAYKIHTFFDLSFDIEESESFFFESFPEVNNKNFPSSVPNDDNRFFSTQTESRNSRMQLIKLLLIKCN